MGRRCRTIRSSITSTCATSTPTNNCYGGHRPGNNLFAESLVCLEAKTGKRVWHFQAVHHGIWDYDFPTHPILGDITVNGRRIKAVIQISKQAFTYAFDRQTGEPVWPIEERPVPPSTVPGERTSPTQPFPTKPPPFDLQGATEENLIDFTPELRAQALEQLQAASITAPLFTPLSSTKGTMLAAGRGRRGELGRRRRSIRRPACSTCRRGCRRRCCSCSRSIRRKATCGTSSGPIGAGTIPSTASPIFKPPYTRVTAIDMNRGEQQWMAPLGNGPRNHPLLKDLNAASARRRERQRRQRARDEDAAVRDRASHAATKWRRPRRAPEAAVRVRQAVGHAGRAVEIDGLAAAAPMTYLHRGKQYILTAVGTGPTSELVALSVP